MTMIAVIALCSALSTVPQDATQQPETPVSEQALEGLSIKEAPKSQMVSLAFGVSDIQAKEIYWFGGRERSVLAFDYRLDAAEILRGFAYGFSLSHEQSEGEFDFAFSEISLNALYQWPHEGFAGRVFPYARLSVLSGMALVQSNTDDLWADRNFVPGIAGALGARVGFGRPVSANKVHWIATVEWEFAARATTLLRLRPEKGETDIEPLRIGDVNLSGMAIRVGVGFEF